MKFPYYNIVIINNNKNLHKRRLPILKNLQLINLSKYPGGEDDYKLFLNSTFVNNSNFNQAVENMARL